MLQVSCLNTIYRRLLYVGYLLIVSKASTLHYTVWAQYVATYNAALEVLLRSSRALQQMRYSVVTNSHWVLYCNCNVDPNFQLQLITRIKLIHSALKLKHDCETKETKMFLDCYEHPNLLITEYKVGIE